MNKARKKQLESAISVLNGVMEVISELCAQEEEAFDNLPESIQESDSGDEMQGYIDSLSTACDSLEDAIDSLEEI